jgi:hypothetical protein
MIGNTDWSVPNQHNCKILSIPGTAKPDLGMIVPYDFDYSGFVDAHYAIPAEGLRISSVRERIFQGVCRDQATYLNAIKEFVDKKESFYKVIRDCKYVSEKAKKQMTRYLDEFFSHVANQEVVGDFMRECKSL